MRNVSGISKRGSEEEKIDLAIRKTREFFESLGVKTRLSQYDVGAEKIPAVVEQLKAHGHDGPLGDPGCYIGRKPEDS